jgi:hypothetical protein
MNDKLVGKLNSSKLYYNTLPQNFAVGAELNANNCIDKLANLEAAIDVEKKAIRYYTPSVPIIGFEASNGKILSVSSNDDHGNNIMEEEEEGSEGTQPAQDNDNDNDASSVIDMMDELDDSGEVEDITSPASRRL